MSMQETQVQSLGRKDPLEKETATHSNILAWKIPQIEEPDGLHPWGHQESEPTEPLSTHAHYGFAWEFCGFFSFCITVDYYDNL